jgi:hypothetical protein
MARTIIFCLLLMWGTVVFANTLDEMKASIRESLSRDAGALALPPAEYEALVNALAVQAQSQGLSPSALAPTPFESTFLAADTACIIGKWCDFFDSIGGFTLQHWFIVLGVLAGMLLILITYVLAHHHAREGESVSK